MSIVLELMGVALVRPYIFSILPAGSIPKTTGSISLPTQASYISTAVVEIRSSISLTVSQLLSVPFATELSGAGHSARLLTPSPGSKSPLYLISTPTDRASATADGSTIWEFTMKSWADQIGELVREEAYSDALALLDSIDEAVLPEKVSFVNSFQCLILTFA